MELCELIQEYRDHKRMHCMEGSRGVKNLCKLCGALGYEDTLGRMGTYGDARLGNLIDFLEDNSGAIEAIVNWIGEQNIPEWKDSLESELPARKVKEEYEDGVCPDCGEEIPEEATEGESCSNCEHVFCFERADD